MVLSHILVTFYAQILSISFIPGAPKVLSGRLAGRLATVAMRHAAAPRSEVSFIQSQGPLSKRHSAGCTVAPPGIAYNYSTTKYNTIYLHIIIIQWLIYLLEHEPSKNVISSTPMNPFALLEPHIPSITT